MHDLCHKKCTLFKFKVNPDFLLSQKDSTIPTHHYLEAKNPGALFSTASPYFSLSDFAFGEGRAKSVIVFCQQTYPAQQKMNRSKLRHRTFPPS